MAREAVAAPDDAQAHAVCDAMRGLGEQILVQQAQDAVHFRGRTLPVGRGEGEERERPDAETRRGFYNAANGVRAGAVSGGAGQPARDSPAAVAVGDDGHVKSVGLFFPRKRELRNMRLQMHSLVRFSAAKLRCELLYNTKRTAKKIFPAKPTAPGSPG